MWIHKLRKKKFQFILIGIILFFSAAIFSACLCFTVETGNYANQFFSKQNCPDVFLHIQNGAPAEELLAQTSKNKDFTKVVTLDGLLFSGKLKVGERDVTPGYYYLDVLTDYHKLSWQILPTAGDINQSGPAPGKIWVTNVYADQKSLRIGDTITLPDTAGTTLTVSALIDDALCPSSMFGVYPFYVSESTLSGLKGGISTRMFALSSNTDYTNVESWLLSLPNTITGAIINNFNVSQLLMSFNMFTMILGSIGMLSAAMIFVVTLVIIRFFTKNNLIKEYHSIGVYKALGFTDRQITGFYIKCYALTGAIGLLAGAAAGLPLGYLIGSTTVRYIGQFRLTYLSPLLAFGGSALLFGLLLFFVWHAHRRVRQITPVQALQIGISSSPKKLTRSLLRNAHSPLATAINDICKHPSFSAMFVTILTVSFYLGTLFLSINYTCNHIAENTDKWFGVPKADCYVVGKLTADKITAVQNDPAVSEISYGSPLDDVSIKTVTAPDGINFNDCSVISWSDFSNQNFFNPCKTGRSPQADNEIAVSAGAVKGHSLSVGDYVTLSISNTTKAYLVTGLYDNMMHAGKTIQMTSRAFASTGVNYQALAIAIKLKSGADFDGFADRVKNQYGLEADQKINILSDSISGVEEIMNPVTVILVTVFILFSLLNIANLLLTTQLDNRRRFGILKSLGFSSGYISRQSLFKTLLLSLTSAALALLLHLLFSPSLFYAFLNINALINSPLQLLTLLGFIFACIIALTLLFCIPLRKVSPVELMEE